MSDNLIHLAVEYEKSIRYGPEQALLLDAFHSLASIASNNPRVAPLFNKVYGTRSSIDIAQVQAVMKTPGYRGNGVLVSPKPLAGAEDLGARGTQLVKFSEAMAEGLVYRDAPVDDGKGLSLKPGEVIDDSKKPLQAVIAEKQDRFGDVTDPLIRVQSISDDALAALSEVTNKRYFTTYQLADYMNALRLTGKLDPNLCPVSRIKVQGQWERLPFEPEHFEQDGEGNLRSIYAPGPSNQGEVISVSRALNAALGSVPALLTEADIRTLQKGAELANELGIKFMTDRVPVVGDKAGSAVGAKYQLRTDWMVVNQDGVAPEGLQGEGDFLQNNAQRPGGVNLTGGTAAARGFEGGLDGGLAGGLMNLARTTAANESLRDLLAKNVIVPTANESKLKKSRYAVLRVVKGFDNRFGDLYPSRERVPLQILFETNHFLLQSVSESRAEKSAMVETFGDTYLYLFGKRPRIYNYSGTLMDTEGLGWLNQWRQAYDDYFGGTQLVRDRARVFLLHEDVVREGIVLQDSINYTVDQMGFASVSFSLFVTNEAFLDGKPYPTRGEPTKVTQSDGTQDTRPQVYAYPDFTDVTTKRRNDALEQLYVTDDQGVRAIGATEADKSWQYPQIAAISRAFEVTQATFGRVISTPDLEEAIIRQMLTPQFTELLASSGSVLTDPGSVSVARVIDEVTQDGRRWSPVTLEGSG